MPWMVGRRTAKGWEIVRADTDRVVGYSGTREKAAASVRARYANSLEFNSRRKEKSYGYDENIKWLSRKSGL